MVLVRSAMRVLVRRTYFCYAVDSFGTQELRRLASGYEMPTANAPPVVRVQIRLTCRLDARRRVRRKLSAGHILEDHKRRHRACGTNARSLKLGFAMR
jgi:hypothetical protein